MKENSARIIKNICCIGAGYVGGPTMAVIADKCPHITVNVVDINLQKIKQWNSSDLNKLPVYEPNLDKVINRCRGRNLFFSTDIKKHIGMADMVFISVNTPTKKKGIGAGKASDLKWVEICAREVAKYAKGHTVVVEKSTLPVRTAEVIKTILEFAHKKYKEGENVPTFDVLSNPEFLSEGTAIKDLEKPDRVLIGGESLSAIDSLDKIYLNWVPKDKILHTNIWSSELSKLTANAFLAQRISSINTISALCEATGADVREVSRAIGLDSRIGSKFLNSGPGFGGSCFKKDILNLVYLAQHYGLTKIANFWESVVDINNWHQSRITQLVVKKLFGTISGKKIAILGFAFKANTNDTRESAAIQICKELIEEGANLIIYDPKVDPKQISLDLGIEQLNKNKTKENENNTAIGTWEFSEKLNIFDSVNAILILTEWEEFANIEWEEVAKNMEQPAWIFDARSIVNIDKVKKAGLNLWRIGNGSDLPYEH